VPGTIDDTIAIAALCQALVAKLTRLNKAGMLTPMLSTHFIEENKWHAMRSGLDAEVIDYVQGRRHSMRESISELLDFVDDVLDDLGSRHEINHSTGRARRLTWNRRGSPDRHLRADRQYRMP